MDYQLKNYQNLLDAYDLNDLPSNIDMYYELSYQLATYIFDYRIKNKMSQTEFAKKLGIKQAMVSKLESGHYNISLENLSNVMSKLNTKIEINFLSHDDLVHTACEDKVETKNSLYTIEDLKALGAAS